MREMAQRKATASTASAGATATTSLLIYLLVAFGFTWLVLAPAVLSAYGWMTLPLPSSVLITLGTLGPFLGGVIATAYQTGTTGVRSLLAQAVRWRVKLLLYGIALAGPALIMLAAFLLWRILGGPQLAVPPANTWFSIPVLVAILFIPALFEEIGWRGFALPRLQARYGSLAASLVLGIVWAVWHAPIWFIPEAGFNTLPFPVFAVFTVALSILLTGLYNWSGGSVLLPALAHAALNAYPQPWNTAVYLLPESGRGLHLQIPVTAILVILACFLVLLSRGQERAQLGS